MAFKSTVNVKSAGTNGGKQIRLMNPSFSRGGINLAAKNFGRFSRGNTRECLRSPSAPLLTPAIYLLSTLLTNVSVRLIHANSRQFDLMAILGADSAQKRWCQ